MRKNDFLGREAELARISEEFEKDPIVVLSGLGGMGKTELAVRYGQEYQESGRGWAYFLHFTGSFGMTLRSNVHRIIPDYSVEGKSDARIEADALAALNRGGKADLLILDNAEQVSIPKLRRELSALRMRVLVTTRKDVAGIVEVKPLPRKALYAIFERNEVDATKEEMDALIDEVDSHTLTVDVMARTMRRGRRAATAEKLLAALRERDLSKGFTKVEIDYAGSPEQARINEHLKAVFRVAELTEEEQRVLCYATLLPTSGMSDELFLVPFSDETKDEVSDVLDDLVDKGWLIAKEGLLLIHPIIRIVCREELQPTDENCASFLNRMWDQYDSDGYDKDRYRQLAELFTLASEDLTDRDGEWAHRAGFLWNELGDARKALECSLNVVEKREVYMPNTAELAIAYNNVGMNYGSLGDHGKALGYELKAIAILRKVLPLNYPSLAAIYNNVGMSYGNLGDHEKALAYKLTALDIREKVLSPEHPDLAASYNNVGSTCGNLGNHERALEYILKALRILEQALPPDHPNLAATYNNVGSTYGSLGDHEKALEYQLKALKILEKALPPEHPNLATSYNNVGMNYGSLGDHKKALEYELKALTILEKALPPDHPNLAATYNNVGSTYGDLGDHEKELEHLLKALAIEEKILPPDHPKLAQSYNNVGSIYNGLSNHEKALECFLKGLEICEKPFTPEYPHRAISYNNVGSTYCSLGDHKKALEYQLKALAIQEKVLPAVHPYNVMCSNNIAMNYARLDDFANATVYENKALSLAEQSMQGHPKLEQFKQLAEMMGFFAMLQEQGIPFDNPFKH